MRTFLMVIIYAFSQLVSFAYKLTPVLPQNNPSGVGVIVCPGGSYFWLDKKNEGYKVAQWLSDHGIAAFVLKYSHAGWASYAFHIRTEGRSFPAGYNDICRALDHVRKNADRYGIKPDRIGFMGFSAGGHLVMHATEQLANDDKTSILPPLFVAPIYPVVSMIHPCTHKRSRRGLLGEFPSKDLKDSLSVENHVPDNCPPVFLMNCDDDPIVHFHNSELLDSALIKHKIPHKYEHYKTGGHGFGVAEEKTSPEAIQWKKSFLDWLHNLVTTKR